MRMQLWRTANLVMIVIVTDDNGLYIDSSTTRYESNSGGFEYNMDADGKIELKRGHIFFTVYDLRRVLQVFVVRNGFRLQLLKSEKAQMTCKCVAERCI